MGKRLGLAKHCRRNLFTGDSMYIPYPNLLFRNPQTEADYRAEVFRFSKTSLNALTYACICLTVVQWLQGFMGFIAAVVCCAALAGSTQAVQKGPLVTRCLWMLPDCILASSVVGPKLSNCFCALLPSFFVHLMTAKHWSYFLLLSLAECTVVSFITGAGCWRLMASSALLTFVTAIFERDWRNLWVLYDSYRKSEALQFRLFEESPNAIFIVSNTGKILSYNHKAKKLAEKLNKPVGLLKTGAFQDLFADEFTLRFKDMISSAMRGEEEEEELFLKPLPSKLDADVLCDLAIGVKFQPAIWKNGNNVRVTCTDISPFMSRRLFLMQLYKTVYGSIYTFLRGLQRLYQCSEVIQTEDMYKYNKIASALKNILVLQSYFLGRIEMKKESYHIKNEITSQVDFATVKAEDLGVTLSVSKDPLMPMAVTGDKHKHNQLLSVLLDFALEQAVKASEVTLNCVMVSSTQGSDEGQAVALYRVAFRSRKIDQRNLDKLFGSRKKDGNRKSLQEIVGITAEFGVGLAIFDTLLTVMRGCVKDAYSVNGGPDNKIVVAYEYQVYRIPLQGALMEPCAEVVPKPSTFKQRHRVEEVKSEVGIFSATIKPQDESLILKEQIHRLKAVRTGPNIKTMKTMPIVSKSSEFTQLRLLRNVDIASSTGSSVVEEDFREDDILEFSGHTVEDAMKNRAACPAGNCSLPLPHASQAPPYRSSTFGRLHARRGRYSRRNPAGHQCPHYQSPLESIRHKAFTTTSLEKPGLEPGPLKVLLVEHNRFNRESFKILLSKQNGCEPDLARDGSEAVEMFSSYASQGHVYFMIFMDIVMPMMDGYQATLAIRRIEQEKGYGRTLICGTSSAVENPEGRHREVGMDFFRKCYTVKKPLKESEVVEVISQARRMSTETQP